MKKVVITGSTRGIGLGLAHSFLEAGCAVVVNGRSQSSVNAACSHLGAQHGHERLFGHPAVVTNLEEMRSLWQYAQEQMGQVDIWVNNAGISHDTMPLWELPSEAGAEVLHVNVIGLMYASQVAMQGMLAQGHGQIYNMEGFGSNGRSVRNGMSLYGTSKAAVAYLSKALIKESKETSVRVGTLQPGMVMTDMVLDRFRGRPEELEKVKGIFNIIADSVENVSPWLVDKMLADNRHGSKFVYAPPVKLFWRFLTAPFSKRDLFTESA